MLAHWPGLSAAVTSYMWRVVDIRSNTSGKLELLSQTADFLIGREQRIIYIYVLDTNQGYPMGAFNITVGLFTKRLFVKLQATSY